jgi:hypothetical protein
VIDIWYPAEGMEDVTDGQSVRLTFGEPGVAQDVFNVLGRVRSPRRCASLSYILNGGARVPVPLGPTAFRLNAAGDFNIELPVDVLRVGENVLQLYTVDRGGRERSARVLVSFRGMRQWPLPYRVVFGEASPICSSVQVVDGLWTTGRGGVRPATPAYDRTIAIGSTSWQNVELFVRFRIVGLSPRRTAFPFPSGGRGFGIGTGWRGHSDWHDIYPRRGYLPAGGLLWLTCHGTGREQFYMQSCAEVTPLERLQEIDLPFQRGEWYCIRLRVERESAGPAARGERASPTAGPTGLNRYRARLWPERVAEPREWNLDTLGNNGENAAGAFLLVAHHCVPEISELRADPTAAGIGTA